MNDALFAPLSNEREREGERERESASKLTGISNKTLWHIKAEPECLNCKISHNKQDNKLYI